MELFDPARFSTNLSMLNYTPVDSQIELLERDSVVSEINKRFKDRVQSPKYTPIIIATSRGMGKTFLLKKLALQELKQDLKLDLFDEASRFGRIISFNFSSEVVTFSNDEYLDHFFTHLLIFYLCQIFAGFRVDGIDFEKIDSMGQVAAFEAKSKSLRQWLNTWKNTVATKSIMEEYIRLTNIAFRGKSDLPPIFLLDEIQHLCVPTMYASRNRRNHTRLSFLLTKLAVSWLQPMCICTGTNTGNIVDVADYSTYAPKILTLTPLSKSYDEYWTQMTIASFPSSNIKEMMEKDQALLKCLFFVSYQIPRLLQIAQKIWERSLQVDYHNNSSIVEQFDKDAIYYYHEMENFLTEYPVEDIAQIILACSVRSIILPQNTVPLTDISWSTLIESSIIFPNGDGSYIFPFGLIWRYKSMDEKIPRRKVEIAQYCEKLVPNLDLESLFLTFDHFSAGHLLSNGMILEDLLASSLAVKYYLSRNSTGLEPITKVYELDPEDSAKPLLEDIKVDFSQGIHLPEKELSVNSPNLPHAVVHNKLIPNAHHDLILPAQKNEKSFNIAVSVKCSFEFPKTKRKIQEQLQVSKSDLSGVPLLIWLYLGSPTEEKKDNNRQVVFLRGDGCINAFTLNCLKLAKNLKFSQNNEPKAEKQGPSRKRKLDS